MKSYKKSLCLSLVLILLFYLIIGLFFYFGYTKSFGSTSIIGKSINSISTLLEKKELYKLYHTNTSFFSEKKADFLFNYSKNDYVEKDSILALIKSGKIKILEDRYKQYRKIGIVENKNEINAKIKLHGSSIAPYANGFESYTIKSKYYVNGYKYFKLITGTEMNYFNVFLNSNARFFNLYSEDSGDIVAANLNGRLTDFFQYSVFDENYIKTTFNIEDPVIIRRRTFDEKISNQWHSSGLDDTAYNIDSKTLLNSDFKIWETFNNNPQPDQYDPEYIGKFMALLQLFGTTHQITGNNDKWILSQGKMFPVYRNEGSINPITVQGLRDNNIFDSYHYYSSSLENYKNFLSSDKVIYYRNQTFKKIIDNHYYIINSLDSIYNKYKTTHSNFNNNYLKIKYNHIYNKRTITNNIKSVKGFLNSGYTLIYFDGSKLKIKSTRVNKLEVIINGKKHEFFPTNYKLEGKTLINKNDELLINNINNISSLIIKDLTLNTTLENEKDYSIIFIN